MVVTIWNSCPHVYVIVLQTCKYGWRRHRPQLLSGCYLQINNNLAMATQGPNLQASSWDLGSTAHVGAYLSRKICINCNLATLV